MEPIVQIIFDHQMFFHIISENFFIGYFDPFYLFLSARHKSNANFGNLVYD